MENPWLKMLKQEEENTLPIGNGERKGLWNHEFEGKQYRVGVVFDRDQDEIIFSPPSDIGVSYFIDENHKDLTHNEMLKICADFIKTAQSVPESFEDQVRDYSIETNIDLFFEQCLNPDTTPEFILATLVSNSDIDRQCGYQDTSKHFESYNTDYYLLESEFLQLCDNFVFIAKANNQEAFDNLFWDIFSFGIDTSLKSLEFYNFCKSAHSISEVVNLLLKAKYFTVHDS